MILDKNDKIFISGHKGMVGSAFLKHLQENGFKNLLVRSRAELDLRNSESVKNFFKLEKPDVVFLIAAKVGGIQANIKFPADFLYDNLMIQNNLIQCSHESKLKKLIFFGSSCIYPRECKQPMKEEYLLTGPLEPTNEGYALAKISGIRLVQSYAKQYGLDGLCIMPSNLYGQNDSFDPEHSHVMSALVKKFVDAKIAEQNRVTVWGTGSARREFFHVKDLIASVFFLLEHWTTTEIINVGAGVDISIKELAELIAKKTGFKGEIDWDTSRPDGMPRKCMDVSKLENLGFRSSIPLEKGIEEVIEDYKNYLANNKLQK